MKLALGAAIVAVAVGVNAPASAWGWRGHEVVGSIAEQILEKQYPIAAGHVRDLLGGHTLAVAATWPDCVKDVSYSTAHGASYHAGPKTPKVCTDNFASDAEVELMKVYAARNWTQCDYSGGGKCHSAYHFDDVAIQRGVYGKFEGANTHDVVHAINAAIAVLQGKPSPAPFKIATKAEALKLLAHFVGDIHQPLHVGSIYLDAQGQPVDPDPPYKYDAATFTVGGNSLVFGAHDTQELHADWDNVATSYAIPASDTLVKEAAAKLKGFPKPTATSLKGSSSKWATEGVVLAKFAFTGLTFGPAMAGDRANTWEVSFENRDKYASDRATKQHEQLVLAGARLAYLLAAICNTPNACKDN